MNTILYCILIIILTIAVLIDIKERKIPNLLTFPSMVVGFASNIYLNGYEGIFFSIEGLALGIGCLLLFYLSGMMGAGDVKLMGAVGSIIGPAEVFQAFIYTAFAGGLYALIVLAVKGQLKSFLIRIFRSLHMLLITKRLAIIPEESREASPVLCYGIAIGVGTVISMFI